MKALTGYFISLVNPFRYKLSAWLAFFVIFGLHWYIYIIQVQFHHLSAPLLDATEDNFAKTLLHSIQVLLHLPFQVFFGLDVAFFDDLFDNHCDLVLIANRTNFLVFNISNLYTVLDCSGG